MITGLPSLLNSGSFKIFPDYLGISMWPVTYYFIGAYISEFKINFSKIKKVMLIFIPLIISTFIGFWNIYINKYNFPEWGNILNVIYSSMLFVTLLNIKMLKLPKCITFIITKISMLSFGMYLVSYIFDESIRNKLNFIGITERNFLYLVLSFFLVVVFSFILSWIIEYIYKILEVLINKLHSVFNKNKKI